MPDAGGRIKGISVPEKPWDRGNPSDVDWLREELAAAQNELQELLERHRGQVQNLQKIITSTAKELSEAEKDSI